MLEMNDLKENIEKLHTTELGVGRIKKNLNLDVEDVVEWCKETTKHADTVTRRGKNWYVYSEGGVITVNASSNTIITAHRVKPKAYRTKDSI